MTAGEVQRAMVLRVPGTPLVEETRALPVPGPGEIRLTVTACAVCRTDLHVVDGDLTPSGGPIVPGHEVVGRVDALGQGVTGVRTGQRVGVAWLGASCGVCRYCGAARENLCDAPVFTGYTRDGGFATHLLADARFCFDLEGVPLDDVHAAPLMCAGLIGWRALRHAGDATVLGLYGFGAAAHLIAQVARAQGRRLFAFTRPGDTAAQALARHLGADWAGASDEVPPEPMDAAILFAPVGALVPLSLAHVRKGGRVVCAGIHMSDIPSFRYGLLWGEREIVSVANLTRADGTEFLDVVRRRPPEVTTTVFPLAAANDALDRLRRGELTGAAVLVP
jgi:propanol-preferring alcohol dehydrogenase